MAQRFEGKNLDEALDHAAETFGVARDQLTHSVILEKRGFLGGVKRIVIEVELNEAAAPPPAEPVAPTPPPAAVAAPSAPPAARERGPRGPRGGGGGGRGRGGNRRDDRPQRGGPR